MVKPRARNSFTISYSLLEISIKSYNLFQLYNLPTKNFRKISCNTVYGILLKQNKSRDHIEYHVHRLLQLKRRLATCINFPCSRFEPLLAIVSSSTERNYEWLQAVIIVKELVTLLH